MSMVLFYVGVEIGFMDRLERVYTYEMNFEVCIYL